jgi:hypothetical protein
MTLTNAFYHYLTSGGQLDFLEPLSNELAIAEYWLEQSLLERYRQQGQGSGIITVPHSRYLGRRAWVGPELPTEGTAGDIWLDIRELTPMMLIPNEPHPWREVDPIITYRPLHCWIACRPIATWQYQAYLALSTHNSAELIQNNLEEPHPATNLTQSEARSYAQWCGKLLPDTIDWQAVQDFLPEVVIDEMWLGQKSEWSGAKSSYDEDLVMTIKRNTLTEDPDDTLQAHEEGYAAPDPRGDRVFSNRTTSPEIGFRTLVNMQFGLQRKL